MEKKLYWMASRCWGCTQCQWTCAKEHGWTPRVTVEWALSLPVPIRCMQCTDAPCQSACPVGAISTTKEGVVVIDDAMCIGCGICAMVCPFGAIHFDGGKAAKCDQCIDRLKEGRPPACVEMCPGMALHFGEFEELHKAKRENTAKKITEISMEYVKLLAS